MGQDENMEGQQARAEEAGRPTADEALIPSEKRFTVGEKEIVLKPFTIGMLKRVSDDIGAVSQEIMQKHPEIDLARPEMHLGLIVPIVAESVSRILGRLFDIEPAYLDEHMPLYQAVEIIAAAVEVNRLPQMRRDFSRARQMAKGVPKIA